MRTVRELRLAGLFAYLASLVIALLLSLALHLLLGGQGELGWEGFNAYGLLEGLLFLLAFTWSLALGQRATRIPCSTLLTAGLFGPRAAKRLARPLARVEGVEAYEGRGLALLYQEGRPVGLLGLSDHILPLEEVPSVEAETAVTELAPSSSSTPSSSWSRGRRCWGRCPGRPTSATSGPRA